MVYLSIEKKKKNPRQKLLINFTRKDTHTQKKKKHCKHYSHTKQINKPFF